VGRSVRSSSQGGKGEHRCVSACGEGAPILWAEGKGDAAIQIEHLWDEMAREYDVDTLCGYVLSGFQREQESHIYERICANTPLCICSERGVAQGRDFGWFFTRMHASNHFPYRAARERKWWYHAWVAIRLKEFRSQVLRVLAC